MKLKKEKKEKPQGRVGSIRVMVQAAGWRESKSFTVFETSVPEVYGVVRKAIEKQSRRY